MTNHFGTLYVVATPIGNLEDLSPRAKRILGEVSLIAAEDTRESIKLLGLMGIKPKKIVSYHDHNEEIRAQALLEPLKDGESVALVSDAGTPGVSDPGFRLVALAHAAGIPVVPVPGPSALTALLSVSGLPTNKFLFVGFLPTKTTARDQEIASWQQFTQEQGISVVFYESTRRLAKTLAALAVTYPHCRLAIGRELTKFHEEVRNFPIDEAPIWLASHATLKGEVAVMVNLAPKDRTLTDQSLATLIAKAQEEFRHGVSLKSLLQKYRDIGLKRSELYALLLEAKDNETL